MLLTENISHDEFKKYLKEFYNYASKKLGITKKPKIVFKRDTKNSEDMFGKTGYYDPDNELIALFIIGRHPKDVLRSFAHELVHHYQKLKGFEQGLDLSKTASDPAYAKHDKGLRRMEKQAFRMGNMLFRDWCDTKKMERETTMSESKLTDRVLEKVLAKLAEASKMPMKNEPEGEDLNGDGKKGSGKVPAFLDKGDAKKKKSGGKVPPQLQKYVKGKKGKKMKMKESDTYGDAEAVGATPMNESIEHPYPELFKQKDRLFKERFQNHEEIIFNELLRRAIKK
jgi:hypothetical protein